MDDRTTTEKETRRPFLLRPPWKTKPTESTAAGDVCSKNVTNSEMDIDPQNGEKVARESWSTKIDFVLSCIGYVVGLGNFWRFPYLCMRNGGGAFLIPYFTFLFLCGMPLFFLELSVAQYSALSPISLWNLCPLFKGIGWSMLAVSAVISVYYNIIISWILYFLGMSFTSDLPWGTCDNWWNTAKCFDGQSQKSNETIYGNTTFQESLNANKTFGDNATLDSMTNSSANMSILEYLNSKKVSSAEEFWQYNVLDLSSGIHDMGHVRWQLFLCLLAAWVLVFLCLSKGVRSSGKVVYVTATVPYIFLTLLLIRGLLLPGAIDGILFYLTPDFGVLASISVWAEACQQIFYSLGPAWGGLITMASYNRFHNNCLRDTLIICFACCGTSFYAGFVCFSILGYMAHDAGVPVSDVVTSGPGLAFIVYPEAITKLPISPMWAIFFFLMLLTLGLDSQFGTFETCTSGFIDEWPNYLRKHRVLFTAFAAVFLLLLGIPFTTRGGMYLFAIVDWYSAAFSVMVIALLECLVLAYVYKVEQVYRDIEMMIGRRPRIWWKICWCAITPLTIAAMIVYSAVRMEPPKYGSYEYPEWAIGIGWAIAMISIVPMPTVAIYNIIIAEGPLLHRIKTLLKPTARWVPNNPDLPQYSSVVIQHDKELTSN